MLVLLRHDGLMKWNEQEHRSPGGKCITPPVAVAGAVAVAGLSNKLLSILILLYAECSVKLKGR